MSSSTSESDKSNAVESGSSTEVFSGKVMAHIWRRMVGLYGHKWSSQYGRAVNDKGQLSGLALDWRRGLSGITQEQLKFGFEALEASILNSLGESWPPAWTDFKKLCLSKIMVDVPTLDEVVSILIMAKSRQGSLVSRYKYSLALAVSQSDGLDMLAVRTAKLVDARRMVKPIYESLLKSGWPDWPKGAHDEPGKGQKALGHDKPVSKSVGRSFFSEIKSAL